MIPTLSSRPRVSSEILSVLRWPPETAVWLFTTLWAPETVGLVLTELVVSSLIANSL